MYRHTGTYIVRTLTEFLDKEHFFHLWALPYTSDSLHSYFIRFARLY